jgi:carotenoid cleavage dioxygenase
VPPILTRLTFDLDSNSDSFERKQLCPAPCEMPRTDDRYQGVPYRYGFTIMARAMDGSSAIGRIDHKTGKIELWEPGPGAGVQEPQFVPRSPDSPEGDGYVLTLVSRHKELRSELAILDAQNLSAGPLALLRMPIRIRATFHGTWAPADVMARGTYNFPPPRVAA